MARMYCFSVILCLLCISWAQDLVENQPTEILGNDIDKQVSKAALSASTSYAENTKPIFKDCSTYSPEVEEAQNRLTWVIKVQAEDHDEGDAGKIKYMIEEVAGVRPLFGINSTTGDVYTNTPFDRDEPTRQKELYVSVKAIDHGRPPLADICTFKVTVLDINDNTPTFDLAEYKSDVSEDLPENSEILRVTAYDFDDGENSRLTYSFSNSLGTFDEYFRIDKNTGVVYLKKRLIDKIGTRISANVVVQDNGVKPNSASVEIAFLVVDSAKKPPRILDYVDNLTIAEDFSDFDKPLVTLRADSNIAEQSVSFELVTGKTIKTNKNGDFALRQTGDSSAIIKLGHRLDYESVTEYQLSVRARNKDFLYTTAKITIMIEDVNDEIPIFIEKIKGSVVENDVPGAQAMQVQAIDKDGTAPYNVVVYELLSPKDAFEIDPVSGIITAKVRFDREVNPLYHVTVQANDSAPSALYKEPIPNSAVKTFFISIEDQNDNKPIFSQSLYTVFNISETADAQKEVIEVAAHDDDTASLIEYSIIEGNIDDAFYIENTTGRIRVNKRLDFEKIESYQLTVRAFDGVFEDTAKVIINIQNENDEPPVFETYTKDVHFQEEIDSNGNCIIQLRAYDPDIKDRNADQKIVYNVGTYDFLAVTPTGCVILIKPLNRDLPTGSPAWQAYINAVDNNGGPNSLTTFAEIQIILEDINDNAPHLNITEVVWYENQPPGLILTLTAIDYDSAQNGPPFTYEIAHTASDEIKEKFQILGDKLEANVWFDREEKKFYDVPILITDSGEPTNSEISVLRVIIGDKNDNAAEDGASEIFVYKYEGLNIDIEIGRIYVEDPDDWDLPDKVFQPDGFLDSNFEIRPGGMILMKKDTPPQTYNLQFIVTEENLPNITKHQVKATVAVTVKEIPEEAVQKSGSIRLHGATIEQLVEKDPSTRRSKKDLLQQFISKAMNTSMANVDVFTVMPTPSNASFVDVRFSAHGSPYYPPERLNNKVTENQGNLESDLGVTFEMVSINECMYDSTCGMNTSCTNRLVTKDEPATVFTNKTSFVGVKALVEAACECTIRLTRECFNGGSPIEDGSCSCPEGFDGPNCETLGISFMGDGWAMYPTFDSCVRNVISFNVLPQADDGLIFYVGPLTAQQAVLSHDFMSVELREGLVVLKLDLGSGPIEVVSKYKKINNGDMHSIKVNYTTTDVQIEVDECPSECLEWREFAKGTGGRLNVNGPLQIGGRNNIFPAEEAKKIWSNPPTTQGFIGCVSNFTYNSYVYHLGSPSDEFHSHPTCNYGMFQAVTFGIDSNFLVAILVCLAILLILLLAVVVHKRKQDNFNEKDMDDTRENIINYEDEGGGECDTNFDLEVLRPVEEKPPMRDNLYKAEVPADIGSFLHDKKRSCDKDNLPCDDVRHYGYEGDGNSSGSLSSLASCTDEGDLKFNYLSSFGPRFRKLADMYGDEEESQNENEEWC